MVDEEAIGGGGRLSEDDLNELADALAIQIHSWFWHNVYRLQRSDIAELIAPYVDDLIPADQQSVTWRIWQLFQEARDIEEAAAWMR
jgi:hypothetical protein